MQKWKKTPLSYKLPAHSTIGNWIGYSSNKISGSMCFKPVLCYYPKGCTTVKNMQNLFPPDGSSLSENYFLLTVMEFLDSKYFHVHNNTVDHNDDYFVYTNIFTTSDEE